MALYEYSDTAQDTTLVGDITPTSVALTIAAGTGWPTGASHKFWVVLDPDKTNEEKILVNTRSPATSLNLAGVGDRGMLGTVGAAHSSGAVVRHFFTAFEASEANAHINLTTRYDHTQYLRKDQLAYSADEWCAGDGSTDDTANIATAMAAIPTGSRLVFTAGKTYIVVPQLQANSAYGCINPSKPLVLDIRGATIKIKNSSIPTTASTFLVYLTGSPDWFAVLGLGGTLDCNGAGSTLTGMASNYNLCGISTRNASQATRLYLSSVRVANASTKAGGSTNYSGIGCDDYGCSQVVIEGSFEGDTCDSVYWHTTLVPNSGLCWVHADKIIGHNPKFHTLNIEEAGQISVDEVHTRLDVAANNVFSLAIFTGTTADVTDVHIGRNISENCQNLSVGVGGSFYLANSSLGVCQSKGAPQAGTFSVSKVKPSVKFTDVIGDASNAGSILTISGADATHYPIFDAVHIAAPSAGASVNGATNNAPFVINSGWVGGLITLPATTGPTAIRRVIGYNPVGLVVVAVPATTVAVAAIGYDRIFHITAGASTCAIALTNTAGTVQTVATIPNGGYGSVLVPAGSTLTPTYAAAPTWTVQGL